MQSKFLTLLAGAAAVSAVAIPDTQDHSDEGTCQAEVVTVKLTSLDHFVGHTFNLLTPDEAVKGVQAALGSNGNGGSGSGGSSFKPSLASFNPAAAPHTTAAAAVNSASPSASGAPSGSGSKNSTAPAGASGTAPAQASGIYQHLTDVIPAISSALHHLTSRPSDIPTTYVSKPHFSLTAIGASASATGGAESSAPFPTGSGSNATAGASGSASGSGAKASTTAAAATGGAASTTVAAASSGASSSASSTLKSSTKSSSSSSSSASASATGGCSNPAIRYEWRDMADADKLAYVKAEKCLYDAPSKSGGAAKNRHDDLTLLHQKLNPVIHGTGQFLAWHRNFLHAHETVLRNECGYKGPMPWWDETKDAGRFSKAPLFTDQYFGSALPKTENGLGACVTNGAFANVELNIGPGNQNYAHCLSRAVDEGLSADMTNNFIATCNAHNNFADMQNCAFPGPHAYGHDAVGAVMSDVATSPGDPLFYLHHGLIDRAWAQWQAVDKSRVDDIGGVTTVGGNVKTTLSYQLSTLGLIPDVEIKDVMDTTGGYLCYKYNY